MSIARGVGKSIGGLIFTLSLAGLIALSAMVYITTYDNIRPLVAQTFSQAIATGNVTQAEIDAYRASFIQYCNLTGAQSVEVPVGGPIGNVTINCTSIPSSASELYASVAGAAFDKIYYKEYSCSFIQCMQQLSGQDQQLYLISAQANKFYQEAMWYAAIGIAVGAALIMVSVRKPAKIAKTIGVSMIVAGIPYFFFTNFSIFQSVLPIPAQAMQVVGPIMDKIASVIAPYYLYVFIIGIVLTVVGVLLGRGKKEEKKKEE